MEKTTEKLIVASITFDGSKYTSQEIYDNLRYVSGLEGHDFLYKDGYVGNSDTEAYIQVFVTPLTARVLNFTKLLIDGTIQSVQLNVAE